MCQWKTPEFGTCEKGLVDASEPKQLLKKWSPLHVGMPTSGSDVELERGETEKDQEFPTDGHEKTPTRRASGSWGQESRLTCGGLFLGGG